MAIALLLTGAMRAQAQEWNFTRVADTGTAMPGTTTTFQVFNPPSIDNGVAGFTGFSAVRRGAYTGSGGLLSVIADTATPAPGGGTFSGFFLEANLTPSLHLRQAAFHAGSPAGGGIFVKTGTEFTPVVTTATPVPNGSGGSFFAIGQASLQSGRVAFVGYESGDAQKGVYSWQGGSLSIVADKSTPIPGAAGTFTTFGEASLDSGQILFQANGTGNYNGLFLVDQSGTIARRYDTNTPIPGATGTFSFLSQSALSAGRVAFHGQGPMQGVYSDVSGQLDVIADRNTPVPGFPGQTFRGFGYVSIDDGVVAFTGLGPGAFLGVFSTHGGTLQKVLANGDLLDGRIVEDAFTGGQALDGNSIAMKVTFTNGTQGIYMATIPAPGVPGALGAVTMLGVALRRRRRGS